MSDPEFEVEDIDGKFVPRPRTDIAFAEIDGELVVTAPIVRGHFHAFDSHWLDARASLVWQEFDGATSIAEIVDLLSSAFGADPGLVSADVLDLARTLARAGLFEGVRAERPVSHAPHQPTGIPVGTEFPFFRSTDLDGQEYSADDLRGHVTLLVNWSPTCGFCTRIARELAELGPDLEAQGVEVLMISRGSVEDNRRVRDEAGLQYPILLISDFEPFDGIGTPSAYLSDEAGRVAGPLVVGAIQVPELARRSAGRTDNVDA